MRNIVGNEWTNKKLNTDKTRLGFMEDDEESAFVWVGRPEDDDAEERVFMLSRKQAVELIGALTCWLGRPPNPRGEDT